jgi:TPR repeat protein
MERPAGSGPYSQQDIQDALQLAKIGDAEAESNLGVMLASRGEYQKAAYWEKQLAMTYDTGQGVPKDPAQVIYWYKKAARQGLPAAQYNLAVIYHNGDEVAQDDVKAYAWMLLAQKGGLDARDALTLISQGMTSAQIRNAETLSHSLSAQPVPDTRQ